MTDGLLGIEERTQDQTPAQNDPLAPRHVNSDTNSEKHSQIDQIKRKREKRKRGEGGGPGEGALH